MKTIYMKTKRIFPALLAVGALSLSCVALSGLTMSSMAVADPAPAKAQSAIKPSEIPPHDNSVKEKLTDSSFVAKAAAGSMTEVEISKIVAAKSSNKKIKKFATAMVKDHETANAKLKTIAAANRIDMPTKIDPVHQKMIGELKNMSGTQLDETYVDLMKKDHDTTVALFDNAAGEPSLNADLRVFANKTLPTLRAHQKHAHALSNTSATAAR